MGKRSKLVEARKGKGFSQEQLGDLVGLSQGGISRLEKGEYVPSADVARKLIDVLGVSLDDVIDGDSTESASASHGGA